MNGKQKAGVPLAKVEVPTLGGGTVRLGDNRGKWRMIVVYRGLHCPLCKKYLARLEEMKGEFENIGVDVLAVSGDPEDKAAAFRDEAGLSFPIAYGLSEDQMRTLGLYVSDPRSPEETDRRFPEPALFIVNPDGNVQIADVSNAPFSRPDLAAILGGLTFIQGKDYPVRGTA